MGRPSKAVTKGIARKIRQLHDSGHSYAKIERILKGEGITISDTTISRFIRGETQHKDYSPNELTEDFNRLLVDISGYIGHFGGISRSDKNELRQHIQRLGNIYRRKLTAMTRSNAEEEEDFRNTLILAFSNCLCKECQRNVAKRTLEIRLQQYNYTDSKQRESDIKRLKELSNSE